MSIRSRERSFKCCNYLGGAGVLFSGGCSADRWLMSRIRSHSFLCLHVCMTLTSWLHRWTWHPLLYQGDVFNGEAGLIVLRLGVGLFQVINFNLLFLQTSQLLYGLGCAVYICHLRRIKLDFHCRTVTLLWCAHTGCCLQENMATVTN